MQGAGSGDRGQGEACLISQEALAGSLPAETRMLLLPGHVVLGGLGTSEERGRAGVWPGLGGQHVRDLATGKLTLS